jgi:type II secretory pathway pseudopilin PulG
MFCFKCGASMPDESTVCPQCAAPVQVAPPPAAQTPQAGGTPPASTSAWLNPPSAQTQYPAQGQYPSQAQPYRGQNQPLSAQQTDVKATASLVLGIMSLFCLSVLAGIPAIILGHMSKANIRRSMGRLKGDGMATAGLVMGYISTAAMPLILIIAAIAIPNLLRAKISANESAAASTMRTINTAQVVYQTKYPEKGYAPDLATLGNGPNGSCSGEGTAEHACLIGGTIGSASCTSGSWCQKGGYRFTVVADCGASAAQQGDGTGCKEYVSTASPVSSATGLHNYCSVSDAIIRVRREGPLAKPPTAEECGEWPPIS